MGEIDFQRSIQFDGLAKLVVVDVEMTGLGAASERIVDVSAVRVPEAEVIDEFATLVALCSRELPLPDPPETAVRAVPHLPQGPRSLGSRCVRCGRSGVVPRRCLQRLHAISTAGADVPCACRTGA